METEHDELDLSALVVYYRVPEGRAAAAKLADQKRAAAEFSQYNKSRIRGEYREVEESGQSFRWPVLAEAIAAAQEKEAVLLIAEIGLRTRNQIITSMLRDSGVKFLCCDDPQANWLTIHILAAMASERSQRLSEHIKVGLDEARAKGVKFGSARKDHWKGREHRRGWKQAVKAASKTRSARAKNQYAYLMPTIKDQREAGRTLGDIAKLLNDQGHLTLAGKPFTDVALWRIIGRYLGKQYLGHVDRGEVASAPRMPKRMRPETYAKRIIKRLRTEGMTFEAIAEYLNNQERRMSDGSSFTPTNVRELFHEGEAA